MNLNKLNLKIINLQTNRHFSDSGTCTRSKIGVPSIKKMFLSFLAGENSLFISFMKLLRFSSLNFFNSFPEDVLFRQHCCLFKCFKFTSSLFGLSVLQDQGFARDFPHLLNVDFVGSQTNDLLELGPILVRHCDTAARLGEHFSFLCCQRKAGLCKVLLRRICS